MTSALPLILNTLDNHKAEQLKLYDLREASFLYDFMIVASALSARHASALSDYLLKALKTNRYAIHSIEGAETGNWVVVDCETVLVHIFVPEVREFYELDHHWKLYEVKPIEPFFKAIPTEKPTSKKATPKTDKAKKSTTATKTSKAKQPAKTTTTSTKSKAVKVKVKVTTDNKKTVIKTTPTKNKAVKTKSTTTTQTTSKTKTTPKSKAATTKTKTSRATKKN